MKAAHQVRNIIQAWTTSLLRHFSVYTRFWHVQRLPSYQTEHSCVQKCLPYYQYDIYDYKWVSAFICSIFLHFSHLDSSDPSVQSSFPSHFSFSGIQRLFLQENSPGLHSPANKKKHLTQWDICFRHSDEWQYEEAEIKVQSLHV